VIEKDAYSLLTIRVTDEHDATIAVKFWNKKVDQFFNSHIDIGSQVLLKNMRINLYDGICSLSSTNNTYIQVNLLTTFSTYK